MTNPIAFYKVNVLGYSAVIHSEASWFGEQGYRPYEGMHSGLKFIQLLKFLGPHPLVAQSIHHVARSLNRSAFHLPRRRLVHPCCSCLTCNGVFLSYPPIRQLHRRYLSSYGHHSWHPNSSSARAIAILLSTVSRPHCHGSLPVSV